MKLMWLLIISIFHYYSERKLMVIELKPNLNKELFDYAYTSIYVILRK
jgi:hypothetical protein